jgi:DNA helicase HerA-like ATPase
VDQPDPHRPTQIAVVGKKGQGKTELAYLFFDSYPHDRVLIDPNGDILVPEGTVDLEVPVSAQWPPLSRLPGEKHERQTLRLIPDFATPHYQTDMDAAVGMAYAHRRTLVFVDEAHELIPAGRTPPHARRALRQARHHQLSTIWATPRPMTVDPLMISQADWVYVFKLPHPDDRKRVAQNIGWDPRDFDDAVHELDDHEYLRYDARRDDLAHFPPLPERVIRHHRRDGA